jgi:hypothetical protein
MTPVNDKAAGAQCLDQFRRRLSASWIGEGSAKEKGQEGKEAEAAMHANHVIILFQRVIGCALGYSRFTASKDGETPLASIFPLSSFASRSPDAACSVSPASASVPPQRRDQIMTLTACNFRRMTHCSRR